MSKETVQEQESYSNRKGKSRSNDENGAGGLYDRVEAYLSPGHISRRETLGRDMGVSLGAVTDRLAGFFLGLDLEEAERRLMAWSPQ